MPIRKKSRIENIEKQEDEPFGNDEMKHCPFCDNKIKVKAVKCQYCGEFLDGRQKEILVKKRENKPYHTSELSAIRAGKALYRGYIGMFVRLGIAILAGVSDANFIDSDGYSALDTIISLIPIILLMIWSNKTYGHLISINTKNLRFNSTGWPTWGRICPIACLYIPYQAVKDIYKTFNERCGIIGWWWACYLISAILLRLSGSDETGFLALLAIGVLVTEYILIIKIIKNINKSLE